MKRNGKCVTKKGNRMKREKRSVFVNLYFSANVLQQFILVTQNLT